MDTVSCCAHSSVVFLGSSSCLLVCDQVQHASSSLRVFCVRSGSLGSRCSVDLLGQPGRLCLFPRSVYRQSGLEGAARSPTTDPYHPRVFRSALIPGSSTALTNRPDVSGSYGEVFSSQYPASRTQILRLWTCKPGCCVTILRSRGYTEYAIRLILAGRLPGTQRGYSL